MRKILVSVFLLISLLSCTGGKEISVDDQESYIGTWEGSLTIPQGKLKIVFHIAEENGQLTAKMDSPDQGAMGIAMDKASLGEDGVAISSAAMRLTFTGALNNGTINGTFTQAGQSLDLVLNKSDNPQTLQRPQEPKGPFDYESIDVVFENPKANIKLAGTLTYPSTGGPFAAAVMITGSGPQNRNEEIFGHKPFLVIADYLTKKGFALLRYDDRGYGESGGDASLATSDDFAGDAEAAMAFLKTRNFINPKKIGFIGHSEGGLIEAIVASRNRDTAFIIMLAGPGIKGDKLLLEQSRAIMEASGADAATVDKVQENNQKIYQLVVNEGAAARDKIAEILAQSGVPENSQKAQIDTLLTPWFIYFLKTDPAEYLQKVTVPVLALFGTKDLQVPYKDNMAAVEKALKKAGNKDFTVHAFPGLNHLFQTADKGLPEEYAKIEETMSPVVLETMSDWLLKRF